MPKTIRYDRYLLWRARQVRRKWKERERERQKIRDGICPVHYLIAIVMVGLSAIGLSMVGANTAPASAIDYAVDCPDLRIIFARGSGEEHNTSSNYLEFIQSIESKISTWGLAHDYVDLDYEAKGIGIENIFTLIGAFFGAGDAYDFGASVDGGVAKLEALVTACPGTKYVLGGYSQGAMVVSQAIHSISADKIIYAATFGDPKIYLPEGKAWFSLSLLEPFTGTGKNLLRTGIMPDACKGKNLSDYRMYVPDCYAYEGMLGSYRPYEPLGYAGKLGTWCNKYDMFCSSYLSASSHTSYVADGLYGDASRVIAAKIAESFDVEERYTSPHDTVILIDSTGSMNSLIDKYKAEAKRLANKTWEAGGRVALYDYRDLADPYNVVKHCDFESCNPETFEAGLAEISTDGGGDTPESLLSASFAVMQELDWRLGATKSLVVLTDAGYHEPDLDGTTFLDVTRLSKQIDPVNFYVVTTPGAASSYRDLAEATGGRVVTTADDLTELTDYIIARYDSLPRVEEDYGTEFDADVPVLEVSSVELVDDGAVRVDFITDAERVLVILDDAVLGTTKSDSVVLHGLDGDAANRLLLVPLSDSRRGNSVAVELNSAKKASVAIPKTPNTGHAKVVRAS